MHYTIGRIFITLLFFLLPFTGYSEEYIEAYSEEIEESIGYNSDEAIVFKLRSAIDRSLSDEIANTGLSSIAAGVVGRVLSQFDN